MDETSRTLLGNIQDNPSEELWEKLLQIYEPFIRSIVVSCGILNADVDDVVQNVLTVVFRRIPDFRRQRTGSFRAWLRAIAANSMREYWRSWYHSERRVYRSITSDEATESHRCGVT